MLLYPGVFAIPNPNRRGNVRFRTGERVFRLTTSPTNSSPEPESFAQQFILQLYFKYLQETIIATRNADVIRTTVSDKELHNTSKVRGDPLLYAWWDNITIDVFFNQKVGYLTKIDVFFSQKL